MKRLVEVSNLITGPVPSISYGLPRLVQVTRLPDPMINAVIHTLRVSGDISVAVTDELFMEDKYGNIVVPIVQKAALKLATELRDELNKFIEEAERESSSDPA